MANEHRQSGFTLIEVAVVLVIVGLLLGGLLMPLVSQMQLQRARDTQAELEQIRDLLIGYAVSFRDLTLPPGSGPRLPCPDTNGDGLSEPPPCNNSEGDLPWATLGISRVDPYGRPYRYRADNEYTQAAGIPNPPDTTGSLAVQDLAGTALTAPDPNGPAALVFSCGDNGRPDADNDADGAVNADANCTNAGAANATYTQDTPTAAYDDHLVVLPKTLLLGALVAARRWP